MSKLNNIQFELKRDWETPFTTYEKGHKETPSAWAKNFGISENLFWQFLVNGRFKGWLKPVNDKDIACGIEKK